MDTPKSFFDLVTRFNRIHQVGTRGYWKGSSVRYIPVETTGKAYIHNGLPVVEVNAPDSSVMRISLHELILADRDPNLYKAGDIVRLVSSHADRRPAKIAAIYAQSCILEEQRGGYYSWNLGDIEPHVEPVSESDRYRDALQRIATLNPVNEEPTARAMSMIAHRALRPDCNCGRCTQKTKQQ